MSKRLFTRAAVAAVLMASPLAAGLSPAAAASTPDWRVVTTISAPLTHVVMQAVAASATTNAWAAGITASLFGHYVVVEHWDGAAWNPVALPASLPLPDSANVVSALGTSSGKNTWLFVQMIKSGVRTEHALHWNGMSWSDLTLPQEPAIIGTVVSSASDAWAFGAVPGTAGTPATPYAAHYNGRTWTTSAVPQIPFFSSAVSAKDIWAVGPKLGAPAGQVPASVAMHWNGTKWHTLTLPHVTGPAGEVGVAAGVVAVGPANVFVTEGLRTSADAATAGVVLLHWNGKTWQQVSKNLAGYFGPAASDGHGGLWIAEAADPAGQALIHYNGGHWTRQASPIPAGDPLAMIYSLALIPGTASLWGAGALPTSPLSGAILKYGH